MGFRDILVPNLDPMGRVGHTRVLHTRRGVRRLCRPWQGHDVGRNTAGDEFLARQMQLQQLGLGVNDEPALTDEELAAFLLRQADETHHPLVDRSKSVCVTAFRCIGSMAAQLFTTGGHAISRLCGTWASRNDSAASRGLGAAVVERCTAKHVYSRNAFASAGPCKCMVCHEEFCSGQVLRILPCLHQYHQHCIDKWLCCSRECPVCMRDVTSNAPSKSPRLSARPRRRHFGFKVQLSRIGA